MTLSVPFDTVQVKFRGSETIKQFETWAPTLNPSV